MFLVVILSVAVSFVRSFFDSLVVQCRSMVLIMLLFRTFVHSLIHNFLHLLLGFFD